MFFQLEGDDDPGLYIGAIILDDSQAVKVYQLSVYINKVDVYDEEEDTDPSDDQDSDDETETDDEKYPIEDSSDSENEKDSEE